ncbi:MAG: hypothetical protein ACXAB4_04880 [Candidatus Hodarchaeales archaeon]
MAKKSNNEQPVNGAQLEIDAGELREQLGIEALEEEIAVLRDIIGQWLTYINVLDKRVQELAGEGTISETLRFNVNPGGKVQTDRVKPALPSNLLENAPKMVPTKRRKNG